MWHRFQALLKRMLDLSGALVLLVVLLPLMAVIAILILIKLGPGGIFFRQVRPGYKEKPIRIIKFRSMLEAFDAEGKILPESERLPPFGFFLRKYSLDELPQLWNILRGEMSFVGPRPLLMEFLEAYPPPYRRRHDVMPGITGWAQVNGRHNLKYSERFELDIWYVDHWSLWLDIKIIFLTVHRILFTRNVRSPAEQPLDEIDDIDLTRFVKPRKIK